MRINNPIKYALLLDEIYAGKDAICPECGRAVLEHKFYATGDKNIGFAQFHCPECGAEAHLSRVKFPKDIKTEKMY